MISVDDRGPPLPFPDQFNLAEFVLSAGLETPDKIAVAILGMGRAERWSHARLRAAVGAAQSVLLEAGLSAGECVLFRVGNRLEMPIAFLACIASGILPVLTPPKLTAREVDRLIEAVRPSAILTDTPTTGDIPAIFVAALSAAEDADPRFLRGDPDRPAYILPTSGTSSAPRLIVHAHRAILARIAMIQGWSGMRENDRVLHAGAMNWSYTLGTGLLDPWTLGATALVPAPDTPIETLPLLLKRHDATIFAAVPGVFRRLLQRPLPNMPKLRHALSAGEKLPDSIRERWRAETGTDIHEAFGQTECSTFLSGCPDHPASPGTLGYVQPGRAVAIIGPTGPVERGTQGEIAVSRDDPGLCLGTLDEHPRDWPDWVSTGDRGVMESDGAIRYLGRSDDVLTAGGFRISPIEVEDAFADVEGLTGIAVADARISEDTVVVAAYYTSDKPLDEQVLRDHAASRLAGHKCPRLFVRVGSLPLSPNGKLLRKALATAKPASS